MAQLRVLEPAFYNVNKWIEDNKDSFVQSSRMKMMHESQLHVLFVAGPKVKKDYHLGKSEELFYMVKGSMNLQVFTEGKFKDILIEEGDVFLLPSRIPHSPIREDGTMGVCIEREKNPNEYDSLRWYVDNSTDLLYEKWFRISDVGLEISQILADYHETEEFKTGRPSQGSDLNNKERPFEPDSKRVLSTPIPLRKWIEDHKKEIKEKGYKHLYDDSYRADVTIYGSGTKDGVALHDTFIWQIDGRRTIDLNGKQYTLDKGDTLFIPADAGYHSRTSGTSYSLFVSMRPNKPSEI